jgi:hypothetical protein
MALSASIGQMVRHFIVASLILLPRLALAQAVPSETEQALRARATEFMQLHVEGNFRKAYDMVAEDTKEDYFNSAKARLEGFKITDLNFTDSFTKATVSATLSKKITVMGTELPVQMPSISTWKMENGKWVWYNADQGAWLTPMGAAAAPPAGALKSDDIGGGALPKNLDDKTIADAARSILQQVRVDKREITLSTDKTSEERVVFHNDLTGSVQLQVTIPEVPGFTVKLEQSIVRASSDAPVVFRYEPGDHPARRDPIAVQILVQPLNQEFVIRVNFAK